MEMLVDMLGDVGTQSYVYENCLKLYKERLSWGYLRVFEISLMSIYFRDWVESLLESYKRKFGVSCRSVSKCLVVSEPFLVLAKSGFEVIGEGIVGRDNANSWVTYSKDDVITRCNIKDVNILPLISMYCAFKSLYEYVNGYSGSIEFELYNKSRYVCLRMLDFSRSDLVSGNINTVDSDGNHIVVSILSIDKIRKL